mmetsp:Transcript_5207/g.8578  ORF Transcript_5207/g.8578 Transcript_5207/m.8578 type:complete len:101 (-) Transcript_5207:66-368(-)
MPARKLFPSVEVCDTLIVKFDTLPLVKFFGGIPVAFFEVFPFGTIKCLKNFEQHFTFRKRLSLWGGLRSLWGALRITLFTLFRAFRRRATHPLTQADIDR